MKIILYRDNIGKLTRTRFDKIVGSKLQLQTQSAAAYDNGIQTFCAFVYHGAERLLHSDRGTPAANISRYALDVLDMDRLKRFFADRFRAFF